MTLARVNIKPQWRTEKIRHTCHACGSWCAARHRCCRCDLLVCEDCTRQEYASRACVTCASIQPIEIPQLRPQAERGDDTQVVWVQHVTNPEPVQVYVLLDFHEEMGRIRAKVVAKYSGEYPPHIQGRISHEDR